MDDIWLPDFLNAQPLGSAVLWSCLAEQLPWQVGEVEFTVEFEGACALAVLVCAKYLEASVERLASDGDRFDYWVWWGGSWFGLEVSGTQQASRTELRQRHREKASQLESNPYNIGGFTVVVSFTTRTISFSAHFPEEEDNL